MTIIMKKYLSTGWKYIKPQWSQRNIPPINIVDIWYIDHTCIWKKKKKENK